MNSLHREGRRAAARGVRVSRHRGGCAWETVGRCYFSPGLFAVPGGRLTSGKRGGELMEIRGADGRECGGGEG